MSTDITIDDLRALSVFEGLPDDVLAWLTANGEAMTLARNDTLFEPGHPADRMIVVVSGALHLQLLVGGQLFAAYTFRAGQVTGMLPYSRMTTFLGRGVAAEDSRLLTVRTELFDEMLQRSHELGRRLVGIMSDRVREGTRNVQQREKMTALGTLSAGLAHELNNPAAAIRRAAESLAQRVRTVPAVVARLLQGGPGEAPFSVAQQVRDAALARGTPVLSTVERGRAEEVLGAWLEEHGVREGWVLAETYVDIGLTVGDLETLIAAVPPAKAADFFAWLEAAMAAERLTQDINSAAARISDLVGAVKSYSHMDRAQDKQAIDLRIGLDSTIVMLGHKIKTKHVKLAIAYEDDLPPVSVYPGEINQVWTNLLDNAIDAVPDGGVVRVSVTREADNVVVRIADNGHGIPEAIQSRIFEPFFTTKGVGVGTGLGLDIVDRIVTQHHGGHISLESRPGDTVFSIRLPL